MAFHYCNYPAVAQHIDALPPARRTYVKRRCFKHVIGMLLDEHSQEQTYVNKVQVVGFDPSTRELELPCGTKLQLISKKPNLLNLSSGPYQFKQHLLARDKKDLNVLISYVKDLYKFDLSECKSQSINDLWSELASPKVMSEAEFYIKFTLAFVISFLAPISFTKVNLDILGDIIPFQRIDTLDWDGFTIDHLAAGVRDFNERGLKYVKGCAYLFLRAEKLHGQMEGVSSSPRGSPSDGNLLVHAGTNSGPFSGSTAVSNLESMSSSAMNDHDLLVKELNDRRILIEGIKDLIKESPGLEVEQGYEAHGGVQRNENKGDQHQYIALPNEDAGREGDEAERELEFVAEQVPENEVVDHGSTASAVCISSLVGDGSTMQEEDEEGNVEEGSSDKGVEDAPMDSGHGVVPAAQPPVDTMEEDQEVSADQGGNNASVDAGNVVVPAAQRRVSGRQRKSTKGDNDAPLNAGHVVAPAARCRVSRKERKSTKGANDAPLDAGHVVAPADMGMTWRVIILGTPSMCMEKAVKESA